MTNWEHETHDAQDKDSQTHMHIHTHACTHAHTHTHTTLHKVYVDGTMMITICQVHESDKQKYIRS